MFRFRYDYVDACKGIAISLIVFGHTFNGNGILSFIYAFHLPVFYFISGLLYDEEKNRNSISFIRRKFRSLLVPYVYIYLISYLYWIIIERHFRPDLSGMELYKPLLGMLYGTDSIYMVPNGALWFLPSLFVCEIILSMVMKHFKTNIQRIGIFGLIVFVGLILSKICVLRLPFSLGSSLVALVFVVMGFYSKNIINRLNEDYKYLRIMMIVICFTLVYIFSRLNGKIDIDYTNFRNPLLTFTAAYMGCLGLLLLSINLKRIALLKFLGMNSLLILAFHQQIKRVIMQFFSIVADVPKLYFQESLPYSILSVSIVMLAMIPLIFFFNRYFYFVTGRKTTFVSDKAK